ncbi:MAG: hypothetical protein MI862_12405 [Desulfobacterales bacterium]|nr:hypothetical protein [Desulfobacterales bacterium]
MQSLSKREFGRLKDGQPVYEYTLANRSGVRVALLDLGCTITRIRLPGHTYCRMIDYQFSVREESNHPKENGKKRGNCAG